MSKRLLTAAAGVLVLAAFAQTANAGPKPPYTVTCAVGGQSSATWSHSKLSGLTFAWTTSSGTVSTDVPVFSPHPPHGFVVTVTPAGATSLTVTFHNTNGTDDPVTQACT
jgi:hypothetical protein